MHLLPPASKAAAPYRQPRPDPTHEVEFWWRCDHRYENNQLLGRMQCRWNDADRCRVERLRTRLYTTLQVDWQRLDVRVRPIAHVLREINRMNDLTRFRRKMGMVLREYDKKKQEINDLKHGIPELAMAELEEELEQAWRKAEKIYGYGREAYARPT